MKIERVRVHNYRSIVDAEVRVDDYLLLVGANNAGKSTFLNALRVFYGQLDWVPERDFPAKGAQDNESWVEVACRISDAENERLSPPYRNDERLLTLRKYLKIGKASAEDQNQQLEAEKSKKVGLRSTSRLFY